MVIDLALDTQHDLTFENYDLQLVDGAEQVRQKLSIRLKFFFGEWFIDNTQGMKLYEQIYVKNPNLTLVATTIKSTILDTEGVNKILEYNQTYDPKLRKLNVDFKVDTVFGPVELTALI